MKDITGQKFNRLTAVKFVKKDNKRKPYWLFKCNCGKEKVIGKYSVVHGRTKSCGCLHKEWGKSGNARRSHGLAKTRFNNIWYLILGRCNDINNISYHRYGDRGIKNLWKSFEEFKNDMYESYLEHVKEFGEKQTTIDRINNDGHYYKSNCRWATQKEQQRNRRNNHLLTFQGQTMCMSAWAEKIGIPMPVLHLRIVRRNWSVEKSLTTPLMVNQFTKF